LEEEIEVIKYLMTNIEIHRIMLKDIYNKKEIKDNLYNYIRYQLREYARFNISLKRMLEVRTKKIGGTKNSALDIAASIGNKNLNINNSKEYINFFKEAAKVNLMDLNRIKQNYIIKSKNLLNLIKRMEEFENHNLEIINSFSYKT
jgi:hypothetical protein